MGHVITDGRMGFDRIKFEQISREKNQGEGHSRSAFTVSCGEGDFGVFFCKLKQVINTGFVRNFR